MLEEKLTWRAVDVLNEQQFSFSNQRRGRKQEFYHSLHYSFFMDINTTKRVTLAPFDVLLLDPTRSVSVFRLPQVLECCRHITLFIMQNGRVVTIGGSKGVLFPSQ